MSDTSKFSWADLPKELLEMISKRLDSRIEVCRFRAVCSSWRSTTSPFYKQYPRTPLKLPDPIPAHAYLTQVIHCRAELVDDGEEDSSSSGSMAWLTKVEESIHGEMQLLASLSNRQLRINSTGTVPKMLNLLNFRLVELCRAYSLTLVRGCSVFGIKKLVLFTSSTHSDGNDNEHGFLVIFQNGKLGYWRFAKEEWKLVDETNSRYDDILVYKEQFYVVDTCGTISWIDSSLNVIQYSPPLYGCGDQKSLVESGGDLYVVDRYFNVDEERRRVNTDIYNLNNDLEYPRRNHPVRRAKTVNIRTSKLDEEWGTWVDVRSLDDKIFVLGNECCFSVSAKDFVGCKGNCIYFIDPADADRQGEFSGYDARVFDLGSGSIGKVAHFPGHAHIFWPSDPHKVRTHVSVGNLSEQSRRPYEIMKKGEATASDYSWRS